MTEFVKVRKDMLLTDEIAVKMPAHIWLETAGWLQAWITSIGDQEQVPAVVFHFCQAIMDNLPPGKAIPIGEMIAFRFPASFWLLLAGVNNYIPDTCQGLTAAINFSFEQMMDPLELKEMQAQAEEARSARHAFLHRVFTGEQPEGPEKLLEGPDGV